MTKEQLASMMDGSEYRTVPTKEHSRLAQQHGLLIVYGASDDLCEFSGAFTDEASCWDGGSIFIDGDGVLPEWDQVNESEIEAEDYLKRKAKSIEIGAVWGKHGYSWTYLTDIPHATFDIFDEGEKYCRGMVVDAKEIKRT